MRTDAGALIALLGVIGGAAITAAANALLAGRQARFRVREKIMDKRIAAYEAVLGIAKDLRETTFPPEPAPQSLDNRIPRVLVTLDGADRWRLDVANVMGTNLHW